MTRNVGNILTALAIEVVLAVTFTTDVDLIEP
jgi:hypothetical protein